MDALEDVKLVPVFVGESLGVESAAGIGVAARRNVFTELLSMNHTEFLVHELLREDLLSVSTHTSSL